MHTGALGWLARLSHTLHLLAAGFWLGLLVPLIACLRSMTDLSTDASVALRRFSGLGHFAVALGSHHRLGQCAAGARPPGRSMSCRPTKSCCLRKSAWSRSCS